MENIYIALFLLGAYHGINPGMGWLFATALGLQTKSRWVISKSIISLTLGHATAIALVIILVGQLEYQIPMHIIKYLTAILLVTLGTYKLFRMKHSSWFGMQIGVVGIFFWSLMMATSHGAGLMIIPLILGKTVSHAHHHLDVAHASINGTWLDTFLIVGIHTLGYLAVITLLSFLVYEKLGVSILKKAWINFDLIWAVTLILTALFILLW